MKKKKVQCPACQKFCKLACEDTIHFFGFCSNCGLFYCNPCGKWKTRKQFIGDYKQHGNTCGDCRDARFDNGYIRPKLRFEILSRDNFTCRYCGASAPDVKLQVDHVIPVSKGGILDLSNLVTACFECNIGKKDLLFVFNS